MSAAVPPPGGGPAHIRRWAGYPRLIRATGAETGSPALSGGPVNNPVVSVIAAGPDETVPHGVPLESVHLPSIDNDEVNTWVAEHRSGPVFIMPGLDLASRGTPALAVVVSEEEYLMLTAAMPH
jgi:hypothetical protein